MMSILLLTLLSLLQAHPELMSRVSLLPVAYVVVSDVQKVFTDEFSVQVDPDLKSRVKVASVKAPWIVVTGVFTEIVWVVVFVDTANMSAQSSCADVQS